MSCTPSDLDETPTSFYFTRFCDVMDRETGAWAKQYVSLPYRGGGGEWGGGGRDITVLENNIDVISCSNRKFNFF